MTLGRRDAIWTAVGAITLGTAGIGLTERSRRAYGRDSFTDADFETLLALAEVVYPSEVDSIDDVVTTYADAVHPSRRQAMTAAIDELNQAVHRIHGQRFAAFDVAHRDALLRELGVHRVHAVADGTVPERIRAYLVNGLLYALFTTPSGMSLVGLENPLGYPGGVDSALGVDR